MNDPRGCDFHDCHEPATYVHDRTGLGKGFYCKKHHCPHGCAPMNNIGHWAPKALREVLCEQQTWAPDEFTSWQIQHLINVLDLHRPLGVDGKHGDLHTPTCGCEDKG